MSDIVERLSRFEDSDALGNGDFSVCIEAADTITRLRAELAEARPKAFEEAAKVARDCAIYDANDRLLNSDIRATCAQAIRAMIEKDTTP